MLAFFANLLNQLNSLSLSDQASAATVIGLLVAVVALALTLVGLVVPLATLVFSAWRFLNDRREARAREQFHLYHKLLAEISRGRDDRGEEHKLVSQLAYIHELRNFPEYGALTCDLLRRLEQEWRTNTPTSQNIEPLGAAIESTIAALEKHRRAWKR